MSCSKLCQVKYFYYENCIRRNISLKIFLREVSWVAGIVSYWHLSKCWHLSNVIKRLIFKNFNSRKKSDSNFRDNLLENYFRHLKLYSIPKSDWLEVVIIWAPFENRKVEVHILKRDTLSGFTARELAAKEDLIIRKQVLLFNLRIWLSQIGLYNLGYIAWGNVHLRNIYCVKAKGFWF